MNVMKQLRATIAVLFCVTVAAAATTVPTGATLDPVVPSHPVGNFPLGHAMSPDGRYVALVLSGWRQQGVQIVDRSTGTVLQTLPQPAAFVGLAFSPDGGSLWVSGGNEDSLFRYAWKDGQATLDRAIPLDPFATKGSRYPAGIAFSRDGAEVYVAENLSDTIAVVDAKSGDVVRRLQTDRYPYAVAAAKNGDVYVSSWGDDTVIRFRRNAAGELHRERRIVAGRHPSALLLDEAHSRLFAVSASTDRIAIIDTKSAAVVRTISDSPAGNVREGSTPNALALSPDGRRLYVAEADNNAVAVFALSGERAKVASRLLGRIPTEWYPTAVSVSAKDLLVVCAKGKGTRPNPTRVPPDRKLPSDSTDYTLGQIDGSVMIVPIESTVTSLPALSTRVAAANHWNEKRTATGLPPFRHVIYIVKENRTYDQVLGDLPGGDGDPSLTYFPREVSPNHHALAERFGTFDRFFVNAEVSATGHNWTTAAYATDYTEKSTPSNYSSRGRTYDYQGTNREKIVDGDDDVAAPAAGYLWDLAIRRKISVRDYGEYMVEAREVEPTTTSKKVIPTREALLGRFNPDYPPFDLDIPDQTRADIWLGDLERFSAAGEMPALQIVWLPNDHTAGAKAGAPTPRAYMADNDLALGRMIAGLTRSPFWKDTAVFVLEDDAQSGPDHVDSHRSVLLVISPYSARGVVHRFVNTTDVLATIEAILGLDSLSQFDHFGWVLREAFTATADLQPYDVLEPVVDRNEKNPPATPAAKESSLLDLTRPDAIDDALFNRILWQTIKGDRPMPPPKRMAAGAPAE